MISLVALGAVQGLALKVMECRDLAKHREERLRRLAERTKIALDLLEGLVKSESGNEVVVRACIANFEKCLQRIVTFLNRKAKMALFQRLIVHTFDSEVEVLLEDLTSITGDIHFAMNIDSTRRAELAAEAARQDRMARELDRRRMEENYDALLRNQADILNKLEIQQDQYAELMEALQKMALSEETKREKVIAETYKGLVRVTGGGRGLHPAETSDISSLEIEFEERISGGGYGVVYKGLWLGLTRVAIKQLQGCDEQKIRASFIKEVNIWRRLRHPHVLPLLGACISAPQPFMVSPFMPNGTLNSFITTNPTAGPRLLWEIAQGMNYLHHHNVIHGDLKGMQILIDESHHAVIADFGFSEVKAHTASMSTTAAASIAGTIRWMSPEILEGKPISKAGDVYAFGMICYEVGLKGEAPWGTAKQGLVMQWVIAGRRPERPEGVGDDLWGIMQRTTAQDPKQRPAFREIGVLLKGIYDKQDASEALERVLASVRRLRGDWEGEAKPVEERKDSGYSSRSDVVPASQPVVPQQQEPKVDELKPAAEYALSSFATPNPDLPPYTTLPTGFYPSKSRELPSQPEPAPITTKPIPSYPKPPSVEPHKYAAPDIYETYTIIKPTNNSTNTSANSSRSSIVESTSSAATTSLVTTSFPDIYQTYTKPDLKTKKQRPVSMALPSQNPAHQHQPHRQSIHDHLFTNRQSMVVDPSTFRDKDETFKLKRPIPPPKTSFPNLRNVKSVDQFTTSNVRSVEQYFSSDKKILRIHSVQLGQKHVDGILASIHSGYLRHLCIIESQMSASALGQILQALLDSRIEISRLVLWGNPTAFLGDLGMVNVGLLEELLVRSTEGRGLVCLDVSRCGLGSGVEARLKRVGGERVVFK